MATNEYGLPTDGELTYAGGVGWLPFIQDLLKSNSALQLGQGSLGQGLLSSLTDLRQNPAAGPLGLASFGSFGGDGQSVAAGTGGKGLVNPYTGSFDRALSGMMSGIFGNPGSIYNPENKGQVNVDNTVFNDPNKAPAMTPAAAATTPNQANDWIKAWEAYRPGQTWTAGVADRMAGGPVDLRHSAHSEELKKFVTDADDDGDFMDRVMKTAKVTKAMKDVREHGMMTEPKGSAPVNRAAGGGVTVGGGPHYIVDGRGQVKANITEDGQPETVAKIPGGVEVTPENPIRKALYNQSKAWSRVLAGLDSEINPGAPMFATGGALMFPNIPGSGVNTTPMGSSLLPSSGGTMSTPRPARIGSYFKSKYDPETGQFTLPSEAYDATSANDVQGYAKLLGGAWSAGNQAISEDALRSMNAGQAPDKLLSATEMATLPQSQQAGYLAFLQQALGMTPEDAVGAIKRFRPTAIGG